LICGPRPGSSLTKCNSPPINGQCINHCIADYVMLGLLSTGKKLTIGLVGAGRAADRGFIDCRNNIATSTKALTTNTSVQLICHSPLSLHLHNSYTEPDFLTL